MASLPKGPSKQLAELTSTSTFQQADDVRPARRTYRWPWHHGSQDAYPSPPLAAPGGGERGNDLAPAVNTAAPSLIPCRRSSSSTPR